MIWVMLQKIIIMKTGWYLLPFESLRSTLNWNYIWNSLLLYFEQRNLTKEKIPRMIMGDLMMMKILVRTLLALVRKSKAQLQGLVILPRDWFKMTERWITKKNKSWRRHSQQYHRWRNMQLSLVLDLVLSKMKVF